LNHTAYYVLISAAVLINFQDSRMVLLSLIVGLNLLTPINQFTTYDTFYPVCIFAEILTALCALGLRTKASYFICHTCGMLIAFHLVGWAYGGYLPDSPYRVLTKMMEYANILACCFYANPIIKIIKDYAPRIIR
jgi:hypothetical protein